MNDPPRGDTVRERMQQLRCEIDEDVEDVSASARTMLDWKHYVKAHPWMCFGAAVALGFLIVPKRSRATRPAAATVAESATTGQVVVRSSADDHGGSDRCAIGCRANIAIRKATAYLGQSAGRSTGNNRSARGEPS